MAKKKIILSIMVSVDGYVCAINGSISLLQQYYQEFIPAGTELIYPSDCGAVLLGRKTYEQYPKEVESLLKRGQKLIVASRQNMEALSGVIRIKGDLPLALKKVQAQLKCNIWIAGGPSIINQLTSVNSVDEIRLTTVPVQLGGGKPLFDTDLKAPNVSLTEVQQYGGLTHSVWQKK
ncbi:dihydrofolate reductase family protein [Ligilactobacillus acidipiscis]|jgi:dihydrofolate reductase|uniref:Riboflavin biosynthesis protein RibD n=1 Tax=Ligilactobacillus acidipiscis TaxID=89059 RepID=A0A1K1KMS0_9LACO|nr:dihydrofolate reductase family protein [Ligilactobacillus acidipiscis]MCI1924393.1 dihydrofolate reductase family protein [Ligilactobacillus acidipiscis]MCI1953871.1 dihydrofolate reductase family protein [Ligilactobacillus acidipiscis]SFV40177.1 riboflavin biosynthesis protein RibD [Ligilactobacillus acidipiscis]